MSNDTLPEGKVSRLTGCFVFCAIIGIVFSLSAPQGRSSFLILSLLVGSVGLYVVITRKGSPWMRDIAVVFRSIISGTARDTKIMRLFIAQQSNQGVGRWQRKLSRSNHSGHQTQDLTQYRRQDVNWLISLGCRQSSIDSSLI